MKNGHPTLNKHSDNSISALLTLLQDEDDKVASLAMEQFLNSGLAEETVAQFQEASEPQLRQRIHQLSGILARRRARREFLDAVAANRLSGWEGLIQINVIYDPQTDRGWIADALREIVNAAGRGATAARVAAVMRDKEFMVPDEDTLDVDLYLLDAVLDCKDGSAAVLCAIAQQIGRETGWDSTISLFEGRFVLIDAHGMLVDPTEGWHVSRLQDKSKIHPCSSRDLWLNVLTQLFLASLVDGNLRDLHLFSEILAALNGTPLDDALPYPLGRAQA